MGKGYPPHPGATADYRWVPTFPPTPIRITTGPRAARPSKTSNKTTKLTIFTATAKVATIFVAMSVEMSVAGEETVTPMTSSSTTGTPIITPVTLAAGGEIVIATVIVIEIAAS